MAKRSRDLELVLTVVNRPEKSPENTGSLQHSVPLFRGSCLLNLTALESQGTTSLFPGLLLASL